jgi:hypothetical protein
MNPLTPITHIMPRCARPRPMRGCPNEGEAYVQDRRSRTCSLTVTELQTPKAKCGARPQDVRGRHSARLITGR